MSGTQDVKDLLAKKEAILQGDPTRVAKQRALGKLTARERVSKLLDQGSFVELDTLVRSGEAGAGVITGYGTVEDRPVYVFSQDFTVRGGAMGRAQGKKIEKVLELARTTGTPVVAMLDSAGVCLDEGVEAMNAYADVYARMARLSGVVPMIALVLGPVVGGASMLVPLADVSIQAENVGEVMVYGPQVVGAMTGKNLTGKALGGAAAMAAQGGVSLTAKTEDEALALAVKVLDLLPDCNMGDSPLLDVDDMNRLLPEVDRNDGHGLLNALADQGTALELFHGYGDELVVALGRLGGRATGFVISNAQADEGYLTPAGSEKAARFIRLCDCFSLPVVSLINSKGVAVPDAAHQAEAMKASAQLLYAYAEATCPKISVVVGHAIGQAYVAMGGKANADVCYAWPGAVISALTPEVAVQVLYAKELAASEGSALKARQKLETAYAQQVADGMAAAAQGMVDDVCDPADTRKLVIAALEMLASKRDQNLPKKHGNMPL